MVTGPNSSKHKKGYRFPRWAYILAMVGGGVGTLASIAWYEMHSSLLASRPLSGLAQGKIGTQKQTTKLCDNFAPAAGPFDIMRGYAHAATYCKTLLSNDWMQVSPDVEWLDRQLFGITLFPIFNEKANTGVEIRDMNGEVIYKAAYPQKTYNKFEDIPPEFIHSLLFVENRELRDDHPDTWNPAIEYRRLTKAFFGDITGLGDGAGASTLATQLEKFKHSPGGHTRGDRREKFRQMITASARGYVDGNSTQNRRREIGLEYINGMPLAAVVSGDVHGLGDGLELWMGEDFEEANALMRKPENTLSAAEMKRKGEIYRKGLALILSVTMPDSFLRESSMVMYGDPAVRMKGRDALDRRIKNFLGPLRDAGVISPRLYEAAAAAKTEFTTSKRQVRVRDDAEHKSIDMLRADIVSQMGIKDGLYGLDRVDVTAQTTIHSAASKAVIEHLRYAKTPEGAVKIGLVGDKMFPNPGTAARTDFSFTLYEVTPNGNVLRIEEDTNSQPQNLNRHVKAGYGSTAKFRTYVDYLEVVALFHDRFKDKPAEDLRTLKLNRQNNLGRWAADYLADPDNDKSLEAMQRAALERQYSANPNETFFTGGGIHPPFSNFDSKDNGRSFTVNEALQSSINLSFIRIMRDIVHATMYLNMDVDPDILTNPQSEQRRFYLEKFVHEEGTNFQWRFWSQQSGKSPEEILELLAEKTSRSPDQLAVVFRSLKPQASYDEFRAYMMKECKGCVPDLTSDEKPDPDEEPSAEFKEAQKKLEAQEKKFRAKFDEYAPGKFDINDRGYRARPIHPLELWIAEYKIAQHTEDLTALYKQYASMDKALLDKVKLGSKELLARWVVDFLKNDANSDKSLDALLKAGVKAPTVSTGWKKALDASSAERITSYKWLLQAKAIVPDEDEEADEKPVKKEKKKKASSGSRKMGAQNTRLHIILEKEAFVHIHKRWQAFGYPFDKMISALDSSLGVSSDRPEALATAVGIIQNGGKLVDTTKYVGIKVAEDTPYWKHYVPKPPTSLQVIRPETAKLAREGLSNVVQLGTGKRMKGAIVLDNGVVLDNGGKTGTDNQDYAINPKRTMTFVMVLGHMHYGVISAMIHDPKPNEKPTSGVVVQLVKSMVPAFMPVLNQAYGLSKPVATPATPASAPTPERPKTVPSATLEERPVQIARPMTIQPR